MRKTANKQLDIRCVRHSLLSFIAQTDPDFDPIRAEAGFQALLDEFGAG